MEEVLKNKYGKKFFSINTSTLPDFLSVNWEGFVLEREKAIEGMEITLEYVKKHQVRAILNNNAEGNGPWPITAEDAKLWLHNLGNFNVLKMAHVVAKQVFGAMSAKMFEEHEGNLTVKYFDNQEAAENWLKE